MSGKRMRRPIRIAVVLGMVLSLVGLPSEPVLAVTRRLRRVPHCWALSAAR